MARQVRRANSKSRMRWAPYCNVSFPLVFNSFIPSTFVNFTFTRLLIKMSSMICLFLFGKFCIHMDLLRKFALFVFHGFTDMETDGNNLTSKATKDTREMELYRMPGGSNKWAQLTAAFRRAAAPVKCGKLGVKQQWWKSPDNDSCPAARRKQEYGNELWAPRNTLCLG